MIELTTKCPQCRHCFEVTLKQLQQRKGLLRCGQCAHIFDAYECAVTTEEAVLEASSLRTHFIGDTPLASGVESLSSSASASVFTSIPEPDADSTLNPYSDIRVYLDREPSIADSPTGAEATQAQGLSAFAEQKEAPQTALQLHPDPYYKGQEKRSKPSVFWGVLLLLLMVIMLMQLLYIYRVQLVNTLPVTRPVLHSLCRFVTDCDLPYMREIDAIEVRQGTLRELPAQSTEGTYAYQLQLLLKNRLAWPQEWPTLVLSFSDAATAGLATIAIAPEAYLPAAQLAQPFASGAQQTIQVPVFIEGKKINGFSIEKYYP